MTTTPGRREAIEAAARALCNHEAGWNIWDDVGIPVEAPMRTGYRNMATAALHAYEAAAEWPREGQRLSPREVADRIVKHAHEYERNDPGSGAGNFLAQVRSALAEQAGEDLAQEARERNSAAAYEASEGKYGQPLAEQAGEDK